MNTTTKTLCVLSTFAFGSAARATVTEIASAKMDFIIRGYRVGFNTSDKVPAGLEVSFKSSDPANVPDDDPNSKGSGESAGSGGSYRIGEHFFNKNEGFTVACFTQSTASPEGSAMASLGAWGEVTFKNTSTSDILILYKLPFRWVSSSIGNHPQLEKGKADPKIVTSLNETQGTVTNYPKGATLANEAAPERSWELKKGQSWSFKITCTAATSAEAKVPSPGSLTIAAGGLMLIARRRRK